MMFPCCHCEQIESISSLDCFVTEFILSPSASLRVNSAEGLLAMTEANVRLYADTLQFAAGIFILKDICYLRKFSNFVVGTSDFMPIFLITFINPNSVHSNIL